MPVVGTLAAGPNARCNVMIIIVMGVSGCGKSTVAKLLAEQLDAHFKDGDELHPARNIERMSNGIALTDADRLPWLQLVRDYAREQQQHHTICIIACSALKKSYRKVLNESGDVYYVFLDGKRELIQSRMHLRSGHFMPESLLDTQYDALESPVSEPHVVTVDITPAPEVIASNAADALREAGFLRTSG